MSRVIATRMKCLSFSTALIDFLYQLHVLWGEKMALKTETTPSVKPVNFFLFFCPFHALSLKYVFVNQVVDETNQSRTLNLFHVVGVRTHMHTHQ